MSFLYIIVGIKHFMDVEYFVSIVPNYISWKKEAVFISGFFEILLGILLLFHKTRKLAAWGIIMLLIAVFPANIYLYVSEIAREILNISKIDALIRIPFSNSINNYILLAFKKNEFKNIFKNLYCFIYTNNNLFYFTINLKLFVY